MALYALDGTGQKDDNPDLADINDTNVARFFRAQRPRDHNLPTDDLRNDSQPGGCNNPAATCRIVADNGEAKGMFGARG